MNTEKSLQNEVEERIKSPVEVWKENKMSFTEIILLLGIYTVLFFFGKIEENKCGLFLAIIPREIMSMLMISYIPLVSVMLQKWKKTKTFISIVQFIFVVIVLMLQKNYSTHILIGWATAILVSLVVCKMKKISDTSLVVFSTGMATVLFLIVSSQFTIEIIEPAGYIYLTMIAAAILSIVSAAILQHVNIS